MMSRILVADDEVTICEALAEVLKMDGHDVVTAADGRSALAQIEKQLPDLVFMDVQMPTMNGLETLAAIRERWPTFPVIMMTAFGTMQTAREAVQLGSFDYIGKPLELEQVRALTRRALAESRSTVDSGRPETSAAREKPQPELLGQSPAMQDVFKMISLLADNDLTVLITGESGVGKELVARAIHSHSARARAPFVAVNCAAIADNLIESELFGHERGAFTGATAQKKGRFEAAGEGTLFLDEIGELPQALQGRLLRVLQEREFERVGSTTPIQVRARIVAATNRELHSDVQAGRFREDLFHRLNLVNLHVPPLRKRIQDIELLAPHFLDTANRELGRQVEGFRADALGALQAHAWPGNIRELENLVRKTVLTAHGRHIGAEDLVFVGAQANSRMATGESVDDLYGQLTATARALLAQIANRSAAPYREITEAVETALVLEALRLCDGNQVSAARLLNINRTTLRKRLDKPVQ